MVVATQSLPSLSGSQSLTMALAGIKPGQMYHSYKIITCTETPYILRVSRTLRQRNPEKEIKKTTTRRNVIQTPKLIFYNYDNNSLFPLL